MSFTELKTLSLALSEEERAELAQTLWESLDSAYPQPSDEYLAELERRSESLSKGDVKGISHEEVMAKARALGGH